MSRADFRDIGGACREFGRLVGLMVDGSLDAQNGRRPDREPRGAPDRMRSGRSGRSRRNRPTRPTASLSPSDQPPDLPIEAFAGIRDDPVSEEVAGGVPGSLEHDERSGQWGRDVGHRAVGQRHLERNRWDRRR